ncbi:MAG: hypothetical protein R3240_06750 [Gammaproteobacteria bacterium]|nr:hypothetical protein [Gammaproteobacteria bacterium]
MSNKPEDNNRELEKSGVDLSRRKLAKAALIGTPLIMSAGSKPAFATFARNNCTTSGNISGNMSNNTNTVDTCEVYERVGKSPGYYKTQCQDRWPAAYGEFNFYHKNFCMMNTERYYYKKWDRNSGKWIVTTDDSPSGRGWRSLEESDCASNSKIRILRDASWFPATRFIDVFNVSKTYDGREATIYEVLWSDHLGLGIEDNENLAFHTIAAYFNAIILGSAYYYTPEEVITLYNTYYDRLTPNATGMSEAKALKLAFYYMEEGSNM